MSLIQLSMVLVIIFLLTLHIAIGLCSMDFEVVLTLGMRLKKFLFHVFVNLTLGMFQ